MPSVPKTDPRTPQPNFVEENCMSVWKRTALACAVTAIFPGVALAQSNEELLKELKALQARVGELEKKIEAADANGGSPQWGMTRDQVHELDRVAVQVDGQSDAMEAHGLKDLKISGMMDPTYVWTQSNGGSFAFLNGFSGKGGDLSYPNDAFGYDNSYFGQAMIDFQKETDGGTRWRLTLAPQKNASSGYNIGSIVHEASVSVALTDPKTRLWAGQIPDWSGYEYVWSNQQPLISHNLLFDFTIPSFYTGAALDLTRGNWETKLLVGNLNASRYSHVPGLGDNSAPVFAYRSDYSMGEYSGLGFAGINGKSFGNRIDTFELDGYFIRGDWTLQGQFGIGRLKNGAANGDAKWAGLSGLVGYNFTPRFKGTVRADYIKNDTNGGGIFGSAPGTDGNGNPIADGHNGFGPKMMYDSESGVWVADPSGKGLNRYALTTGLSYLFGASTTLKLEYRLDGADGPAFLFPDGNYKKTNQMLSTSVVVSF
jgi:hypothetical protein